MSAFLSDGIVTLKPVERNDLELLCAWRNDPEIRSRTREWKALTSEDQARWFERITSPYRADHMFVVMHHSTNVKVVPHEEALMPIGVVGLCGWNMHDRHAEISFYIGERDERGKGLMKRALTLLIEWGFQQGLHRIWAEVYDFNATSEKLLERLGFTYEGVLRQHAFRDGCFVNSILMGRLASDKSES